MIHISGSRSSACRHAHADDRIDHDAHFAGPGLLPGDFDGTRFRSRLRMKVLLGGTMHARACGVRRRSSSRPSPRSALCPSERGDVPGASRLRQVQSEAGALPDHSESQTTSTSATPGEAVEIAAEMREIGWAVMAAFRGVVANGAPGGPIARTPSGRSRHKARPSCARLAAQCSMVRRCRSVVKPRRRHQHSEDHQQLVSVALDRRKAAPLASTCPLSVASGETYCKSRSPARDCEHDLRSGFGRMA